MRMIGERDFHWVFELAELETYLKNEFDQYVKSCAQCRRVVTEVSRLSFGLYFCI